jgi:hypothetical protein
MNTHDDDRWGSHALQVYDENSSPEKTIILAHKIIYKLHYIAARNYTGYDDKK